METMNGLIPHFIPSILYILSNDWSLVEADDQLNCANDRAHFLVAVVQHLCGKAVPSDHRNVRIEPTQHPSPHMLLHCGEIRWLSTSPGSIRYVKLSSAWTNAVGSRRISGHGKKRPKEGG